MMNKKGSLTDTIYVPAYILLLSITAFIGLYIWMTFQTGMTTVVQGTPVNDTVINTMNDIRVSMNTIDYMWPLLVAGLLIVSLIFAYKTGASVMYAVVSIIAWAFALMFSAIYSNIFEVFAQSFVSVGNQYTIMSWVMMNMKWVVLAWLFIISVVMFTRNKQEDQSLAASERVFANG